MKKAFPMLQIMATLSDAEVKTMLPFLNHHVCEAILECCDHGICNETVPDEVRIALGEKYEKHKKKLRFLINKEEFGVEDPKQRKQILEKKKKTLAEVGDCVGDFLSVAIPALRKYIGEE